MVMLGQGKKIISHKLNQKINLKYERQSKA